MVNSDFEYRLENEASLDDLRAFLKLLLPIEHEVIFILFESPFPLSAKEIVNKIVDQTWESVKYELEKKGLEPMSSNSEAVLKIGRFFPSEVSVVPGVLQKAIEDIDYSKPPYKIIEQKKSNLIKSGVSFPDPRKIEKILSDLGLMNLVISRWLTDRKIKTVYTLNPNVYKLFQELWQ